jgi:hypothetical protein
MNSATLRNADPQISTINKSSSLSESSESASNHSSTTRRLGTLSSPSNCIGTYGKFCKIWHFHVSEDSYCYLPNYNTVYSHKLVSWYQCFQEICGRHLHCGSICVACHHVDVFLRNVSAYRYLLYSLWNPVWRRGRNTSTVALRVVEGDEKGTRAWVYNLATLLLGETNTGTWSLQVGDSTQEWRPCSVKNYCWEIKKVQTNWFKSGKIF